METIITSLRDVVRDVKFLVGDLIWIIGDALVLLLSVDLPSPDYISGGTFGASRKGGVTVEKLMRASKPKTFCKTKQSRLYFPRDCNLTARCNPSHNSKTFMGIRGKPSDKTKSQISHLLRMPLSLPYSGRLWETSSALVTSLIIWGCSNAPLLLPSPPISDHLYPSIAFFTAVSGEKS